MTTFADRVRETATRSGTGPYAMAGAVAGHQTWVAAGLTGASRYYCAVKGSEWEVGVGTVAGGSPPTLTSTVVLGSSNAGADVPFVGTVEIFNTIPAVYLLAIESSLAGKAAASHTHSAADLVSGIIPSIARIATGTPDGTKFVRDDRTLGHPTVSDVAPGAMLGTFVIKVGADLGLSLNDGDPVGTWPDQSGNSHDLTSISGGSDRPTFKADPDGDGLPVIRFDGTDDGLRVRALTAYTGVVLTEYLVIRSLERGTARTATRLDDQSTAQGAVHNSTLGWTSGNYFGAFERGGGSAQYAARPSPAAVQQGADGSYQWTVIARIWGPVGGVDCLRIWDTAFRSGCNPSGSGSAFGFTRFSIGGKPNDSTDAWVASNFLKCDVRFAGYCHEAHTEAQVKNNLQYLAARYKVGGIF